MSTDYVPTQEIDRPSAALSQDGLGLLDRLARHAGLWLALIIVLAVIIRLPYWDVIPASFDEVEQTSFAYQIANGQILPLTGNDAYAGPFYFYVVAALIRLGATDPMIGRLVVLVAGVLTVPVTYAWVAALGKRRLPALLAALFVALNPDLILVNSHIGGTTLLLPFLTTLYLLCLTLAVERDSVAWLLAAGVVAGLAMQSNMVAALLVAGGLLWFLWQVRGARRLGKAWPLWPAVLGLVVVLVFSPIIIYNLSHGFGSVDALEGKSYLWESNPTVATTVNNLRRFSLQTIRQTSGVLDGDEEFDNLIGFPLIYLVLMLAGLAYTTARVSRLPLLAIAPVALIMPIASSHYGFSGIGRFTTMLVPIWGAAISFLLAAALGRVRGLPSDGRKTAYSALLAALGLFLLVYPVAALTTYYRDVNAAKESGRAILDLSRYPVSHNEGEPVYISTIEELSAIRGIPYVPHAAFLLGDIYHEFLPADDMIARLYEKPGPAYFILSDGDAARIAEIVPLERLDLPANDDAALEGYGLYRYTAEQPLRKPDFVLAGQDAPAGLAPQATFGGGVRLLGCEPPAPVAPGTTLTVTCYWQATGELPPARYTGFAHLLPAAGGDLLAQDDHPLGRRYPLSAWGTDEVIRENHALAIPAGAPPGPYSIELGVYTWPDLTRLDVPDDPNDVAVLGPVQVEP